MTQLNEALLKERDAFFARVGRLVLESDLNGATPATVVFAGGSGGGSPRFKEDTSVIVDTTTGLMWSRTLACGKVEHDQAVKEVAKLNADKHLGFSDWRLPHVRELHGLVDFDRTDPAIDTNVFGDTKSDWYWSGTPFAGHPACAWFVHFGYGDAGWNGRYYFGFVRAVRGPVARAGQ